MLNVRGRTLGKVWVGVVAVIIFTFYLGSRADALCDPSEFATQRCVNASLARAYEPYALAVSIAGVLFSLLLTVLFVIRARASAYSADHDR